MTLDDLRTATHFELAYGLGRKRIVTRARYEAMEPEELACVHVRPLDRRVLIRQRHAVLRTRS